MPSSTSEPDPENAITSPVAHVVPAVRCRWSHGPPPTVIVIVFVSDAPEVSVTRSPGVNVPP